MTKVPPRSSKVSHGRNPASAGSSGNPVVASSARHDPVGDIHHRQPFDVTLVNIVPETAALIKLG
jgi:hypothetical protein